MTDSIAELRPTATAALLDEVLCRSVVIATGNEHAKPRPQQADLAHLIADALAREGGQTIGEAPTGTGKSLAYLAVVMMRAAMVGERAVVSTESLSLQAQIVDKDAPVVAQAVKEITGRDVSFALLKGWSNYVCARAASAEAEELVGHPVGVPGRGDLWDTSADEAGLAEGDNDLLSWAMRACATPGIAGDRHSYPGAMTEEKWQKVSVTPGECVGVDTCPFSDQCKPAAAKTKAAEADIIVTNHALLAVQAAHQIAAVVGSARLGDVDSIIVDEAHALPAQVRSQGAGEVSGRRIRSIASAMDKLVVDGPGSGRVNQLVNYGAELADLVDSVLAAVPSDGQPNANVLRLSEDDGAGPASQFADKVLGWLKSSLESVRTATSTTHNTTTEMKVRRFESRIESVKGALSAASRHEPGVARWVEVQEDGSRLLRYSPVDVSAALSYNLWSVPDNSDDPGEGEPGSFQVQVDEHIAAAPRIPLTVAAVSATLPSSFPFESGLRGPVVRHTSPLIDALHVSALYVPPALDRTDVYDLARRGTETHSKPKFDTGAHMFWAAPQIVNLVRANGGRALVLSATATAGRHYANTLRDALGDDFDVVDQWSGRPLRQVVDEWRRDETSVLVGTRSLMTGVDAPGDTCSLVILDRIPRSPSNPVDDARLEDAMERLAMDKWAADRHVYVSDAALLLAQAAGRLVRRVSDRGLVAVLDPRLRSARGSVFRYAEGSRRTYLEAVGSLGRVLVTQDEAINFLTDLRKGVHHA